MPNLTVTEQSKHAAEKWKLLSKDQKAKYQSKYEDNMMLYKKAVGELSSEQHQQIQEARVERLTEKKLAKRQSKLKKEMRELIADRPKRRSSWQLFLQDNASGKVGKLAMQKLSEEFKNLTPTKKLQYKIRADEAAQEMEVWRNKINEDGRKERITHLRREIREGRSK